MQRGNLTIRLPGVDELATLIQSVNSAVKRIEVLAASKPILVEAPSDPWLDAEAARRYLGNMSKSTFDKYRYLATPRLKGHKLDGKTLYKRSELDNYVRLYEIKAVELA